MLAVVKKSLAKSGLEPDSYSEPHRSESTALSTQPNPHPRAFSGSTIVQFRIRVYCSQINHALVSKAAMTADYTLHPCGLWLVACGLWRRLAKKENKHRWSRQHVQLLWRNWARQSSQVQEGGGENVQYATNHKRIYGWLRTVRFHRPLVQDQSICMVHIFAGGSNTRVRRPTPLPRENEHQGAHFRGWCTNSLANLCAGARLRGGNEYAVTPAVSCTGDGADWPKVVAVGAQQPISDFFGFIQKYATRYQQTKNITG